MTERQTKALITGGGGFVGPHLAQHLADCGDEPVALDLNSGPDLRDASGWAETMTRHRPDVVYHLAGMSDVGGSWQKPVLTFEINTVGTVAVLDAAVRAGVGRVVVISSAEVYGTVSADQLPVSELQPAAPRSPYGASKQAAEAAALHYWRGHGLETIIARPFNHLGPGQSTKFAGPAFASQVADAERNGGGVVRHGTLEPRRDLTDVRDVVRAYRLLSTHGQPGHTYNVCSGESVSMGELLESLLALSLGDIKLEVDPERIRPVEVPILAGSFDKLASATGWTPNIPLKQTLSDVLDDARRRIDASVPQSG